MRTGRWVALLLAVVTLSMVSGGALAMAVGSSPVPTTPPPVPSVTYSISTLTPNGPIMFAPFTGVAPVGLAQIHFISHSMYTLVFQLRGLGINVAVPAHASVTMLVYLSHPGQFAWINQVPTPGSPPGMTVGFLTVGLGLT